jgi:hypothetical protein
MLQQIPSVQMALSQSPLSLHVAPLVHLLGHGPPQSTPASPRSFTPLLHEHLPAPSQVPSFVQSAFGSWPATTFKHLPPMPPLSAPSQLMHVFVHALSQHTPSTQSPLRHASGCVHPLPSATPLDDALEVEVVDEVAPLDEVTVLDEVTAPDDEALLATIPPPMLAAELELAVAPPALVVWATPPPVPSTSWYALFSPSRIVQPDAPSNASAAARLQRRRWVTTPPSRRRARPPGPPTRRRR